MCVFRVQINKFIFEQAKIALETCDLILFLLDGRTGITNLDKDITNILRAYKSKKNILLVINKIDDFRRDKNLIYEFLCSSFSRENEFLARLMLAIN